MTRINTLSPEALTDQHLMAEYRELPMVMAALRRSLAGKKGLPAIPPRYTLNQGHVCFFYNKRAYLERRYAELIDELNVRGFRLDPARRADFSLFDQVECMGWEPDALARQVNLERILLRLRNARVTYRYKGSPILLPDYEQWVQSFL